MFQVDEAKRVLPAQLGAVLKHLRKSRGLRLKHVAQAAGVSIGQLSVYERGEVTMSLRTLVVLANFYEASPSLLLQQAGF